MEGWIKLHRSFLDHWLCTEYRPLTRREAWETIIFTVNIEPDKVMIKGELYECDRGQSVLSLDSWAKKFNWTVQQVRTFFKLLEADKMITVEGLHYTTRLTVCNYANYQDKQHAANTPLTDGQHAANTPLTTIKEEEELKKNKNNIKENIKRKNTSKSKTFVPPTLDEMRAYFIENGYKVEIAEKAYRHYSSGEWNDAHGNPVKNWKQKVNTNWFKNENKIIQKPKEQKISTYDLFNEG